MPCFDPGGSEEELLSSARRSFRHNSDVAEMLCDVLKRLDATDIRQLPPGTQKWWVEHQERDAAKSRT